MNTYITLACVLAVAGLGHGSAIGLGNVGLGGWGGSLGGWGGSLGGWGGLGYGYGGLGSTIISAPIVAPAAVSTANLVKAAPIPVIRTIAAPILTAPIVKTVPVLKTVPVSVGWNGLGLDGGLGWSGIGAKGLWAGNSWAGNPWGGYGWNGLGGLGGWKH